ncbi:hypothetical protein WMY93_011124 [Mugilogobius chulae]|uniref:Uncharacterized protein n=1 Tax=Mugilogobius chulae TaxID=88201 RepID=A0AAW0P7S1_9GOBI
MWRFGLENGEERERREGERERERERERGKIEREERVRREREREREKKERERKRREREREEKKGRERERRERKREDRGREREGRGERRERKREILNKRKPRGVSSVLQGRGLGRRPQLVPVDPVLSRTQTRQRDKSLAQNRIVPKRTVAQNSEVDHPVGQVRDRDLLVHQLWKNIRETCEIRSEAGIFSYTSCGGTSERQGTREKHVRSGLRPGPSRTPAVEQEENVRGTSEEHQSIRKQERNIGEIRSEAGIFSYTSCGTREKHVTVEQEENVRGTSEHQETKRNIGEIRNEARIFSYTSCGTTSEKRQEHQENV